MGRAKDSEGRKGKKRGHSNLTRERKTSVYTKKEQKIGGEWNGLI